MAAACRQLFGRRSLAVIGMVHAHALPGSPMHRKSMTEIIEKACEEADIYKQAGVDAVMVENMHDVPYQHSERVGPESTAAITMVCHHVRGVFDTGPVGVQILAGANRHALAVAKAAGLQFIRAEGFVFSHIADEGHMDACAGDLLRYRKNIQAEDILVFADIKKKHSAHSITDDVSIEEMAKAAEFFLSDGVIVTGSATGQPADAKQVSDVETVVSIPVLVGSGVTDANLHLFPRAAAVIVGSHFKRDGLWHNDLDTSRIRCFMECARRLCNGSDFNR